MHYSRYSKQGLFSVILLVIDSGFDMVSCRIQQNTTRNSHNFPRETVVPTYNSLFSEPLAVSWRKWLCWV